MAKTTGHTVLIRFPDLDPAAANQAAQELEEELRLRSRGQARFKRQKESDKTQDFGATLVVIFGTPAVIALAAGIRDYIASRGHRIKVTTRSGTVVATGDAAKNIDVAATTKALEKATKVRKIGRRSR